MRDWIALGLLTFGFPLYGQQATARLLGTVLDPSSATIVGATVTVTSVAPSQQRSALTSPSGEYSIPFLPIGEYTMLVQAPGFQPKSLKGIVLQVDQEARFDVTLNVGSATDAVTVQAESPLLVTDVSSVGQWARILAARAIDARRRVHSRRVRYHDGWPGHPRDTRRPAHQRQQPV